MEVQVHQMILFFLPFYEKIVKDIEELTRDIEKTQEMSSLPKSFKFLKLHLPPRHLPNLKIYINNKHNNT
jgi:hypothetical protein